MKIHVHYYLKDSKKEESLVFIICRWNKKSVKVSTRQTVHSETWNTDKQRCDTGSKYSDRVNRKSRKVNKFLDELYNKMCDYFQLNHPDKSYGGMTPEFIVKRSFQQMVESIINKDKQEEEKKKITPLQFFTNYVEQDRIDAHTGRYVSERTKAHHRTVLSRFKKFFKEARLLDDWSVFHNATQFNQKFMNWCYKTKHYKENTVYASYGVLKPWINAAKNEGYEVGNSYHMFKGKGHDVDNIYLTEDEIEAIYKLDIPKLIADGEIDAKSTIEQTRDLFIISCWTGLRRSDVSNLNKALIDLEKKTIELTAEKTKRHVVIPMHPMVLELYHKYNGKFPKLIHPSHSSIQLQECGRLANLDGIVSKVEHIAGEVVTNRFKKYQLMGFHTGRRSFATNMYKRGCPSIAIMQLTGHTSEKNFLKYIKVTPSENAMMLAKQFEKTSVFFKEQMY